MVKIFQQGQFSKQLKYKLSDYPKIIKIIHYLQWILFSKKVFTPPKKSKLLLYDSSLLSTVEDYISKWNPEILDVRGESLNIYVLFRSLFQKKKKVVGSISIWMNILGVLNRP